MTSTPQHRATAAYRTPAAAVWLALCVSAVLYLGPLLLDAPLTDPDEGLHATIAQRMADGGDWVVPRRPGGEAFLDKPVLYFWAQAASIRVLGSSAAAARLPGCLFAIAGVATTAWLALVLFDPATAAMAAGCYATLALPFLLAQAPVHDVALVPFTTLALGCLWRARWHPVPYVWLAGAALGLSVLTKGLEAVALVGVGYALYLLLTRTLTPTVIGQGLLVIVLALVVAAPWYIAMDARTPGYLRYYFIDRHLLGFATDTQRHGGQPWWFYAPLAAAGGLPWLLYVRVKGLDEGEKLMWAWLAGALMLLSLSGSKTVTYVLPVMPALAILAARSLAVASDVGERLYRRRVAHAGLFLAITAVAPWVTARLIHESLSLSAAALFAALSLSWLALMRRSSTAWGPLVAATAATYALAFALLGPAVARAHSARDLAGYFNAAGRLPETVFVMDGRVSFVFYLRADLRTGIRPDQIRSVRVEDLAALRPFPRDAVVALPADLAGRLSRVPSLAGARREAAGRYVVVGCAQGGC